ncbi:60S ribosomal export protein NMD3 [Nematocida major]|uniref:60S ribosomal export protein NMD3 n=1 Tax=Nematocida major TaxID=1912982 RepID=UPI0020077A75|nr:60S ribosomal export protein NMD3 [Nematocida major]KAH9386531.1 60S ribosomal export protein NMD3 [Nematocida major]
MRCCLCGIESMFDASMCFDCAVRELPKLKLETTRQIDRCSTCMRYSVPPSGWTTLRFEGPEMLAYLLKKIPELSKLRLVDAYFIHSEEHSKRVRMKVSIDRTEEVGMPGAEHTEELDVTWVIKGKHCLDCARAASNQTWSCVVQLRQKSKTKQTLLLLEQAILKAGLHEETTDIKGEQDGIDFFFNSRTASLKLVRFIEDYAPSRVKVSEQLVTLDKKSNNSRYKFAYSVEIPALNVNDLLYIPEALAKKLSLTVMCIVIRISQSILLADSRGQVKDLGKVDYFRFAKSIRVVGNSKTQSLFQVVEVDGQNQHAHKGKAGASTHLNFGRNQIYNVVLLKGDGELVDAKTLVKGLEPGVNVVGYDLINLNTNLDIDASIFLIKKETGVNLKWKIKRVGGGYQTEHASAMIIDAVRNDPSLLKTVDIYDENDKLIKGISLLKM